MVATSIFFNPAVFVNGKFSRTKLAKAEDFFFSGLNMPGNTSNQIGSKVNPVNVEHIPGLNTLGISLVRIDFAPYGGLNLPHSSSCHWDPSRHGGCTLCWFCYIREPSHHQSPQPWRCFVFPVGLIHFLFNGRKTNAVAFAGLSSQNPGVITIANAVFGSNPAINPDILVKAFQLDKNVVNYLQSQFWWDSN
ncbi:germin-like protein subfamily 1 member 7 [Durio zibethinus]|uniref:Germin-like protein n=1 Tax=Durio zibethinus TaxID=66656 RepID=A0A6P5YUR4_DURZI|nr:germin-like protein subfamily 1 member 7 [Durio zibethinus]